MSCSGAFAPRLSRDTIRRHVQPSGRSPRRKVGSTMAIQTRRRLLINNLNVPPLANRMRSSSQRRLVPSQFAKLARTDEKGNRCTWLERASLGPDRSNRAWIMRLVLAASGLGNWSAACRRRRRRVIRIVAGQGDETGAQKLLDAEGMMRTREISQSSITSCPRPGRIHGRSRHTF